MNSLLPALDKEAVELLHFPTKHLAFIFRAYEYVPIEKIAKILKTSPENVRADADAMGLPDYAPGRIWLEKGYITIIRRMWHILPYDQLIELLEMSERELALIMKEEDFLDVKLSSKPVCERVLWRPLTDDEKARTAEIKSIMSALDLSGVRPFEFKYSVPQLEFAGGERFGTRMIYAFSGLYQKAFDVDSETFLPDDQLAAYQKLGINGIWTQGVLSQLADFPFDRSISDGYEKRLERMRALTERLDKFGIKLYLYLNEPRYMPLKFFEDKPDIRGHVRGDAACMCTSSEKVQTYLKNSVEHLCRAVPLIGGFFTITRSENLTNCYSHADKYSRPCNCPRCKDRSVGEVISETVSCFLEGARRISKDIKIFAWSWAWNEACEEIIRALPTDVILLSQSELKIPFEIGGVQGKVVDYSMSIIGPGDQAKNEWKLAQERGLEVGAKVQINTTWEASTVPALPVSPSIKRHIQNLCDVGVKHLMLSWTLGGYPCRNIAAAAEYFYEKCISDACDPAVTRAEEQFVKAFSSFPFDINVLYRGPQNAGPSSLLFPKPTEYKATMTCFAYDDLERWRSIYPVDVFEAQFARLCDEWKKGLDMLNVSEDSEIYVMAWAAYCLFSSSLNQIRFVRARDGGRTDEAVDIAREEQKVAKKMLSLMNKNAAIGYEAANHYYFSKGQIAEKIVNCQWIIDKWK